MHAISSSTGRKPRAKRGKTQETAIRAEIRRGSRERYVYYFAPVRGRTADGCHQSPTDLVKHGERQTLAHFFRFRLNAGGIIGPRDVRSVGHILRLSPVKSPSYQGTPSLLEKRVGARG